MEESWRRSEVKRSRKTGFGCNYNNGNGSATNKGSLSTWIRWSTEQFTDDTIENTKANQPKCFLSMNYKPWRDTIYFIIYEHDKPNMKKREHDINVTYRAGKTAKLHYTCRVGEGPWGDKKSNTNVMAFNGINTTLPTGHVFMIAPTTWPGGGAPSVNTDSWTFLAMPINSGSNPDNRSIKVKVTYGF